MYIRGVSLDAFCSIARKADKLVDELKVFHHKLQETNRIKLLCTALERLSALKSVNAILAKMEVDISQIMPIAEANVTLSTILGSLVPLLDMTAKNPPSPVGEDLEDKKRFLNNAQHTFETQVLGSQLDRLCAGTGSTKSAYNFVMNTTYFSGLKVNKDYKRSL